MQQADLFRVGLGVGVIGHEEYGDTSRKGEGTHLLGDSSAVCSPEGV